MTKTSFEQLTGLEITEAQAVQLTAVEQHSNCRGSEFAKQVTAANLNFLTSVGAWVIAYAAHVLLSEKKIENLGIFIFAQSLCPDRDALADKAREILGQDKYLARLLEAGGELNSEDATYLAQKLWQK